MQFSLQPPIASFLSVSNSPLSATSFRNLSLYDVPLHGLKDQVAHPHTTRRSVAVLYILINKAAHKQQLTRQLHTYALKDENKKPNFI
jgi:hypothetical protein